MSNNLFTIQTKLVVLSTDIPNNKQFILSLNDSQIQLPSLELTHINASNINNTIVEYLKGLVAVSEMEMIPQIISINDIFLPNKTSDTIYLTYGFIISLTPSLNNCYWYEFKYAQPTEYSNLIFRVIQSLS